MKKLRIFLTFLLLIAVSSLLEKAIPSSAQAEVKTFNISAIDVDITIDRFGDHDPLGKMYVLDENVQAVRTREAKPLPDRVTSGLRDDPIQPLVIRRTSGTRW